MDIYSIYIPELGEDVKIKFVHPSKLAEFTTDLGARDSVDFVRYVIEKFVYNAPSVMKKAKDLSEDAKKNLVLALYNGCVMLNPGIDIDQWLQCAYGGIPKPDPETPAELQKSGAKGSLPQRKKAKSKEKAPFKLTRAKIASMGDHLRSRVVGQDEAVSAVEGVLRRSQAGLGDPGRPIGVFLFAGSSGTGKTHLARELHNYVFGTDHDMIRIDCGEYQHKHENQKLLGSPPGYVGHEDGGQLSNMLKDNPNTVVLLDEVEKAHPDLFHTFLRLFDEGVLTDSKGKRLDFQNTIIIMTTNLGNDRIVDSMTARSVGFGQNRGRSLSRDEVIRETDEAIRKMFKPEFLNRIDRTVIFNHLSHDDFHGIAELEVDVISEKLGKKGITLNADESVLEALIAMGVDPVKGARGMKQVRRDQIESVLSDTILDHRCPRGTLFDLFYKDGGFEVNIRRPKSEPLEVTDNA